MKLLRKRDVSSIDTHFNSQKRLLPISIANRYRALFIRATSS